MATVKIAVPIRARIEKVGADVLL